MAAESNDSLRHRLIFDRWRKQYPRRTGWSAGAEREAGYTLVAIAKRGTECVMRAQLAHLVVERYDRLLVMASFALGKRKADELLPALRASVPRQEASAPAAGESAGPG